jgi:metallo-beta-lactamase family protein
MKLQFCGAARTVTGSCYYLETESLKILVDCGAFQGPWDIEKLNYEPFPFDPGSLDYVLLTHAHYDHTGRLPLLVKQGFKGKIVSTQPTKELTEIILLDSVKLQEEEFKRFEARAKIKDQPGDVEERMDMPKEPLYREEDVKDLMTHFQTYPHGDSIQLGGGVEFRMRDSGHILGSASFEIWAKSAAGRDRKIVFSGDLGQPGQRIVKDPDMIREADYVIVESTYGNRMHKNKDETVLELLGILKEVGSREGIGLMPVFAIERAQELIYELNLFYENRLVDDLPVYLDSPMAVKATGVFKAHPEFYDEDAKRLIEKGDDPFEFPGFHMIESVEESKRLVSKRGVIIMAGSGMMTGGRILHHAKQHLSNPKTHLLIVGFQVEGTLGRQLVDGEPEVYIHGQKIDVRAKVHTLGGFSAHGDQRDLRYWLRGFGSSPKRVFVTHGEEEVSLEFAKNVNQELHLDAIVPNQFEEFELE